MTDTIGVRELQHELSEVTRRVRRGHTIKVFKHGKPLFTIIPNEGEGTTKTHTFADLAKLHFSGDPNLSQNVDEVLCGKKT